MAGLVPHSWTVRHDPGESPEEGDRDVPTAVCRRCGLTVPGPFNEVYHDGARTWSFERLSPDWLLEEGLPAGCADGLDLVVERVHSL
jgi:hypothetical protein